jgi:NADH:ubiquinone oxidoreductase subunit F (NADH-binding)
MTVLAPPRAPALPGVRLPSGIGERPDRLLLPGTALLQDVVPGRTRGWADHDALLGPLPTLDLEALAAIAARVDLRGFGGAAFPTAVKLRAAADRRPALVVVNASEGELASAKDGVLLRHVPHVVLDGALLAAHALGADGVTVRVAADRPDLPAVVAHAAAERGLRRRVRVSVGPATFAAGEATAVVNGVLGRPALPSALGRPPRTPSPVRALSRPALVSNVETFARLALAARGWPVDSALLTISGAVARPGVLELPPHATLSDAVTAAGGETEPVGAVVTGGWHGRWLEPTPVVLGAPLTRVGVDDVGGRWGAGIVVLVPQAVCPLQVVAAVAGTLASGSAGQCGPCASGLPFLARQLAVAAHDPVALGPALVEADDAMAAVRGRGLCAHPTAAVDALRSALHWAGADVAMHRQGGCVATGGVA